jgi:hypothetical protein
MCAMTFVSLLSTCLESQSILSRQNRSESDNRFRRSRWIALAVILLATVGLADRSAAQIYVNIPNQGVTSGLCSLQEAWHECNRKMDRIAKHIRKLGGRRGPDAHRISSGSDRKLSGATRDQSCDISRRRPLMSVRGRPSRTSELEIRATQPTSSGGQRVEMCHDRITNIRCSPRSTNATIADEWSATRTLSG